MYELKILKSCLERIAARRVHCAAKRQSQAVQAAQAENVDNALLMRRVPLLLYCGLLVVFFSFFGLAGAEAAPGGQKARIEVAFVLDTTGSMSGLIDGAKKKIWSMANAIVDQNPEAEIYVGLVGYRDVQDEYVTRHFQLTTDIQAIYAELLKFEADGGGDTPESVNEALDVAVTQLGWSDKYQVKANRIVFLVGDAPPHMDYKQDRQYPVVIKDAVRKGIIVNTVQCGDMRSTTAVWKEIARLGKGDYMAIPQDGGRVIIIETPYDADILIIQKRLNKTVIPYGSVPQQNEVISKTKMYERASPAAVDMSSYINKADKGASIITGSGDLVADIKNNRADLTKIKEDDLPENLRKMSADERSRYIAGQTAERESLSKELSEKVSQRDRYIFEKEKEAVKTGDSFDVNVSNTLRKQVK